MLKKIFSSDPSLSFGRIVSAFFALYAVGLSVYCVFIRGTITPTEERLIEFFGGFAVSAYSGAKIGDALSGRITSTNIKIGD
jgi:hypothetical protein